MKRLLLFATLFFAFQTITGCGDSDNDPKDTTPPTVLSTTPSNDATNLALKPSISITFSEAMDHGSVEAAFLSVPALPAGIFTWAANTLTFTPATDLDETTQYTITLATGAKDVDGNPLSSAYTFSWKTGLPYKVINLQSDFGYATSNSGVIPSSDGKYLFWWDGTNGEGSGCNVHLYRVKISDASSQTIWTNRSVWGIYDDGVNSWLGNYYPYEAARISNSDVSDLSFRNLSLGHTIALNGNKLNFASVYFGNSNGAGIGYWNKINNSTGIIPGSSGAYVYQSAVIGNEIYFPRGYTTPYGIMVVDAANSPTTLKTTLLAGDSRIANANDIYNDGTFLYVHNGNTNQIHKIDPVSGVIIATFLPGVPLINPAIIDNHIYAGSNNKNVYLVDKTTGSTVVKDCSAFLPTTVGTPRWDSYNDGIWYGPQNSALTDVRKAYFIPRSVIENSCQELP